MVSEGQRRPTPTRKHFHVLKDEEKITLLTPQTLSGDRESQTQVRDGDAAKVLLQQAKEHDVSRTFCVKIYNNILKNVSQRKY